MAQDMLFNDRQTEVTALTGAISDYGKKVGVPTPTCDTLTQVVKAIEANYDKQYFLPSRLRIRTSPCPCPRLSGAQ